MQPDDRGGTGRLICLTVLRASDVYEDGSTRSLVRKCSRWPTWWEGNRGSFSRILSSVCLGPRRTKFVNLWLATQTTHDGEDAGCMAARPDAEEYFLAMEEIENEACTLRKNNRRGVTSRECSTHARSAALHSADTHAREHTHTFIHIHIHTQLHIHTHTYTYTHTYVHLEQWRLEKSPSPKTRYRLMGFTGCIQSRKREPEAA